MHFQDKDFSCHPIMSSSFLFYTFISFRYILTEICSVRRLSDDRFLWKPVRTAFATGTGPDPSISCFSSSHTAVRVSSNQSQTRSCTNYTNRLKKYKYRNWRYNFQILFSPNVIYIKIYWLFRVLQCVKSKVKPQP